MVDEDGAFVGGGEGVVSRLGTARIADIDVVVFFQRSSVLLDIR